MANPYHDESGKFCSRDEMRGALKRVASTGNLEAYFTLQQEYDAIEEEHRTKDIEQAKVYKKLAFDSLRSFTDKEKTIELARGSVDSEVLDELVDQTWMQSGDPYSNASIRNAFLGNENISPEATQKIVDVMSTQELATAISDRRLSNAALKAVMDYVPDNEHINTTLIQHGRISNEEARELASRVNLGYTYYAAGRKEWDEDLDEKVYAEINSLEEPAYLSTRVYLTKSTHEDKVLDVISKTQLSELALENPNLTPKIATTVLSRYTDRGAYGRLRNEVIAHPSLPQEYKDKLEAVRPTPIYEGKAPSNVVSTAGAAKAELADYVKRNKKRKGDYTDGPILSDFELSYNNAMARVDTYRENYATLHKSYQEAVSNGKPEKVIYDLKNRIDRANVYSLQEKDKAILGF